MSDIDLKACTLQWLYERGHITNLQLLAGLRLFGSSDELKKSAMEALGPDLSEIAWRVICERQSLPMAERELAWPVRSGKLVLRIALDRLVDFYQIVKCDETFETTSL